MPDAKQLPTMPRTVEVWHGPTAEKALASAGLTRRILVAALDRSPESVRRYMLAPEDPKAVEPAGWIQSVLAQWAGVQQSALRRQVELLSSRTNRPRLRAVPQLIN